MGLDRTNEGLADLASLVLHSDRDSQYTSPPFRVALERAQIGGLMDGGGIPEPPGRAGGNLRTHGGVLQSTGLHSSLGYMTPVEYEEAVFGGGCPSTTCPGKTRCRAATKVVC